MLDRFLIFARSGLVLFSASWVPKDDIVGESRCAAAAAALVRESLLASRAATSASSVTGGVGLLEAGEMAIKWCEATGASAGGSGGAGGLVFAAILDRAVARAVRYTEPLLISVRDVFVTKHGAAVAACEFPGIGSDPEDIFSFRTLFNACLTAAENSAAATGGGLRAAGTSQRIKGAANATAASAVATGPASSATASSAASATPPAASAASDDDADEDAAMFAARASLSLRSLKSSPSSSGGGKPRVSGGGSKAGGAPLSGAAVGKSGKALSPISVKDFSYSKKAEEGLDRSAAPATTAVERVQFHFDGSTGRDLDESDAELVAAAAAAAAQGGSAAAAVAAEAAAGPRSVAASLASWVGRSQVGTFLASLTGNKVLDREDLAPAMEQLQTLLVSKNVAREPAEQLCASVLTSLEGRKLEAAGSVATVVAGALRDAIERILTPRRPVDLLAEVRAKRAAGGGPYVIAFVGVNGVGKSTSLSKVAYHLKDNRHSVLIAACDSFRAGAVEQLKRHCDALDIPLYSQGYSKDPVHIAAAAVRAAAESGADVVLIDTAGRMQNNEGLMKQLAKLVSVNDPDLVLFVGEALVGNDGVDQLSEFNARLAEYAANRESPRRIDGIVMTKFDCVDDKVGAALSMVYETGIPVLFLGTGQRYTDLRKLNVGAVVKALLA